MAARNRWFASEVQMQQDLLDWQRVSEPVRLLVGGILKSFTQIEILVSDYWSDTVAHIPGVPPEVVFMAREFSSQECNHAVAYDHLESSLGIDTFEEFQGDPIAQKRIGDLLDLSDSAASLAFFSGAVEGVSLNASFAILLYLSRFNLFRGVQQIISWSAHDEALHSRSGILLAAAFGNRDSDEYIFAGFDAIVTNELAFIGSAFERLGRGSLELPPGLTSSAAEDFIYRQANQKLNELGLPSRYPTVTSTNLLWDNFNVVMKATPYHDFFAGRNGGSYSTNISQEFSKVDINRLSIGDFNGAT